MTLQIKGNRVNLRKLRKSDAPSVYKYAKDKKIAEYTTLPHPYKLEHAEDFIRLTHQHLRKESDYELGIELKETGEIIGMMSLIHLNKESRNAEIGYWLGKKYWSKGLAKEALRLIIDFGFTNLNLVRLYAKVMHPNESSLVLLRTLGFKYEGRSRKSAFRHGRWYDDIICGLLKEEYRYDGRNNFFFRLAET